ncbi:hypothetical protein ABK040_012672 [Willaertia magna]
MTIFASSMQFLFHEMKVKVCKTINVIHSPSERVPLLINHLKIINLELEQFHCRFKHIKNINLLEPKLNFLKLAYFNLQLGFYTTELMKIPILNPPIRNKFNPSIPIHQSVLLQNQLLQMFKNIQSFQQNEILKEHSDNYIELKKIINDYQNNIDDMFKYILGNCKGINLFDIYFRYGETLFKENIFKSSDIAFRHCIEEFEIAKKNHFKSENERIELTIMKSFVHYRQACLIYIISNPQLKDNNELIENIPDNIPKGYWDAYFNQSLIVFKTLPNDLNIFQYSGFIIHLYETLKKELPKYIVC